MLKHRIIDRTLSTLTLLATLTGLLQSGQASAANQPPTISVVEPAGPITLVAPASLILKINAADPDGSIAKVEILNGRNVMATATPTAITGQYIYNWTNIAAGSYGLLLARATDNQGEIRNMIIPVVTVVNNTPPAVSMTASPVNAQAQASITLTATATDSDGTIAQVNFYNGTTLLTTITSAPYTTTWGNVSAGTYNLTAVATDNNGAATTSNQVTVTVSPAVAQVYYIQTDQINTPRQITDSNGNIVWAWENNDPFGVTPPNQNPAGQGTFVFNKRFTGQYFDKETGLFYNMHRDYDPSTGRYLESDPLGLGGGINTFAYVGGNPVSSVDPSGEIKIPSPAEIILCFMLQLCNNADEDRPLPPPIPTQPGKNNGAHGGDDPTDPNNCPPSESRRSSPVPWLPPFPFPIPI